MVRYGVVRLGKVWSKLGFGEVRSEVSFGWVRSGAPGLGKARLGQVRRGEVRSGVATWFGVVRDKLWSG